MRLLARRVYRAFPELDSYTDEQCERFVDAAKSGWSRVAYVLGIGATVVIGLIGCFFVCAYISGVADDYQRRTHDFRAWSSVVAYLAMAPLIAVGPMLGLLARDVLLRWRVKRILRTQGVCPKCSYRLVGLSLSAQNTITCPECGLVSNVDPSLSELTVTAEGRTEFRPSVIPPARRRIFTRKRVVRAAKVLAVLLLAVAVVAGGYEAWVRVQVAKAHRNRPTWAQVAAVVDPTRRPAGDSGDGWPVLLRAIQLASEVDDRVWRNQPPDSSGNTPSPPEPDFIYSPPSGYDTPEEVQRQRELVARMIGEYRAAGVFSQLNKLAATPDARRPLPEDGKPLSELLLPELGKCRSLTRYQIARMTLARKSQDLSEYADAFETALGLGRVLQSQGLLIDSAVGYSIERLALREATRVLCSSPSAEWVDALSLAIERQRVDVPISAVLEVDRLCTQDFVCDVFGSADHIRFGGSDEARDHFGLGKARLGSYGENRRVVEASYAAAVAWASLPAWKRTTPVSLPTTGGLACLSAIGHLERLVRWHDQLELRRTGAATLIAIERFRLAHGAYPASLAELPPGPPPNDLYYGQPLQYKRVDPAVDPLSRSFILYSVGPNGIDDGGSNAPVFDGGPDLDIVLNDPDHVSRGGE